MMIQLDPPIPMFVPGKGEGLAHVCIDYGIEYNTHWVVILKNSEVWTVPNPEVRGTYNQTLGRVADLKDYR